jgi:GrpB-like predicted nucleotidyltransferase (UPF0157 family)
MIIVLPLILLFVDIKCTVFIYGRMAESLNTLIEIVHYKQDWPMEFRRVGAPLREAMGELAVRIDHIGSTSVPGLVAKDVIDVQTTVETLDADAYTAALAPLGYTLLGHISGDHMPFGREGEASEEWSKLIFRGPEQQRRINLHIRQVGRSNQRYALLFRDYLRADPRAAGAYGQIKTALAHLHPGDIEAYYDVKDPVCDVIMAAAERWAAATNYTPGPSDI